MIIGEILIIISGLFLGYVFPDLLNEYGAEERFSYSYISVVGLGVIPLVAYVTSSVWINWQVQISGLEGFTNSVFMWLSLTLIIGGFVRIAQHYFLERD